ncbi:MAG: MFS transporter [Anaerolineae bacterium]|nr:MFS transporter [Anaerolineae bacterium]
MQLTLLALTAFVLFLSTLVGTPVIPDLVADLGGDAAATAATLSAALMTVVLLQFFTGGLADRFGRRPILAGAALAGGLTSLGCALANSWSQLLALRILGGVADAVAMPALLGLTAEISRGRQGTFFGVLRSAQGLSFLLGPAIGGALSLASLRTPFLADAGLSLIACGLLLAFVPAQAASPTEGHAWAQLGRLKTLFADRRFYAFALFGGVNNVAFPVLSAFVPVKARALGADPRQIAFLIAFEAGCFSLASWLAGRASDRYGRRPFVIAAQPCVLIACVGLALAPTWPSLIPWYALYGFAGGTTFLLGLVMAADLIPADGAATTLGAFDAAIDLLLFAAPALALFVYNLVQRVDLLLLATSLPALVALPVALFTRETLAPPSLPSFQSSNLPGASA